MPKYCFIMWEEAKYAITFEADNLEHAKKLIEEAEEISDADDLPNAERYFKKGDEYWDTETLFEVGKEDA